MSELELRLSVAVMYMPTHLQMIPQQELHKIQQDRERQTVHDFLHNFTIDSELTILVVQH